MNGWGRCGVHTHTHIYIYTHTYTQTHTMNNTQPEKEQNTEFFSIMDGPRDCHTEWSQTEKEMYNITYM